MTEPLKIDEIIRQSQAFEAARQRWMERKNKSQEPTEAQREYAKKVFAPQGERKKLSPTEAKLAFWHTATEIIRDYKLSDKDLYANMVTYFFGHGEYPADKGLLIVGSIGSGKSLFIRIMQQTLNRYTGQSFRLFSAVEVEQAIRQASEVEKSIDYSFYDHGDVVFDDLGAEQEVSVIFGNRVNVMAEIIQRRYNRFQTQGIKTHFTTNLSPDELKARYGYRVYDRMVEMTTGIIFNWKSFRK